MAEALIHARTRLAFREYLVHWSVKREIEGLFSAEDIKPSPFDKPEALGVRATLVEQYYASLDFSKWDDVRKLLNVYASILITAPKEAEEGIDKLKSFLLLDGFEFDNHRIVKVNYDLPTLRLAANLGERLDTPQMIMQISRIESAVDTDPALAIGTAKELLETCCKTILSDRDVPYDKNSELSDLVKLTQRELKILPDDIPDAAKGADSIKRMLSNLGDVVRGMVEVRNLYGTGHGKHGRASSIKPRHAKLAVGAATTLAVFLYETHLENPKKND